VPAVHARQSHARRVHGAGLPTAVSLCVCVCVECRNTYPGPVLGVV
jgi:hypothetical protein